VISHDSAINIVITIIIITIIIIIISLLLLLKSIRRWLHACKTSVELWKRKIVFVLSRHEWQFKYIFLSITIMIIYCYSHLSTCAGGLIVKRVLNDGVAVLARSSDSRHHAHQRRVLNQRDVIGHVVEARAAVDDVTGDPDDDGQWASARWHAAIDSQYDQTVRVNLQPHVRISRVTKYKVLHDDCLEYDVNSAWPSLPG